MGWNRKRYKWFYDHIHSRYYAILIKWCFLPFGGEDRVRKKLINHIDFSSKDKILDMCCGIGGATFIIAEKAGQDSDVVGMDLSSGQIEIARKNNSLSNVRFVAGDVTSTGFEDGNFDKIFITHALHEMPRKIRLEVLSEAKRILRKTGEVIILELDNPENIFIKLFIGFWFFYWLPFNFETPTRRDMLKRQLATEMEEIGFKSVKKQSMFHGVFQVVQGVSGS